MPIVKGLALAAHATHFVAMQKPLNRIRDLRLEAGLSQQTLGERVGVSRVTICGLEQGKMSLTLAYMRRIADALGVEPTDLIAIDDNPDALSVGERALITRLRAADASARAQLFAISDVLLGRAEP